MGLLHRRVTKIMAIAGCCGLACCLAFSMDLFDSMQLVTGDVFFKIAGTTEKEDRIAIVAIDDRSLQELGKFSAWPRSHYAGAVDRLKEAGARVIAFDVLFSEPSPDDARLAASIKSAGNVILPVAAVPAGKGPGADNGVDSLVYLRPVRTLAEGAAALGHANVFPGRDGAVRDLSLTVKTEDGEFPALAVSAVYKYLRLSGKPEYSVNNGGFTFAAREIPVTNGNEMVIRYANGPGGATVFPQASFVDVLNGAADPRIFNDRIVLIGATGSGLGDAYWTPLGTRLNGVEIHASSLHTILSGNFIKHASPASTIASILILCFMTALLVLLLQPLAAALLTVALGAVYVAFVSASFSGGLMFNPFYPMLSIAISFTALSLYNFAWERSRRNLVERTFGRYVSTSVSNRILKGLERNEYTLKGQEQEITVAFADIRGFGEMAASAGPRELVASLNKYLGVIIKAVSGNGGMVNKFNGDGVMAVWNAPATCADHPLLAVRAAFEAQKAIRRLQEDEPLLLRMDFGFGISTGNAVCGNLGCDDRLEYSAIGVTVNSAARLTSIATGGTVLIGEETFRRLTGRVVVKQLGEVSIKRESEIYRVYEVLEVYNSNGIELASCANIAGSGLKHIFEKS
jgi:adenylate cyclase